MDRKDLFSQPRSFLIGVIQIAGVVLIIVLALVVTQILSRTTNGVEAPGPQTERPVAVELAQPVQVDHRITVEATGVVAAQALTNITPQVSGRIVDTSPSVRSGGAFEAGEVLFRIDPRGFQVAVQRAEAALADARSAMDQIAAEAEVARAEWEAVYPGEAISPLAAREPQLEAARARVQSAEADVFNARLNLERTRYSLPFDGRIVESRIEEGQQVSAGQSFGTAYDLQALEIVVPLAPAQLRRLGEAAGLPVTVLDTDGASDALAGAVDRVGAQYDARSRQIDLFITVEQAGALRPGAFVDVRIEGPVLNGKLAIPSTALAGASNVLVVDDGVIEERPITVLDRPQGQVIAERFDVGEGVVISPTPEGSAGRRADIIQRSES